jgi:hypothetical protein
MMPIPTGEKFVQYPCLGDSNDEPYRFAAGLTNDTSHFPRLRDRNIIEDRVCALDALSFQVLQTFRERVKIPAEMVVPAAA